MKSTAKEVKRASTKEGSPAIDEIQCVRLADYQFFIGTLKKVIEPNQEDFVIAIMDIRCPHCNFNHNCAVKVPKNLAQQLKSLVGKRGNISRLFGEFRVTKVKHYGERSRMGAASSDLF